MGFAFLRSVRDCDMGRENTGEVLERHCSGRAGKATLRQKMMLDLSYLSVYSIPIPFVPWMNFDAPVVKYGGKNFPQELAIVTRQW
jgi:hypothetical protein